MPITYLLEQPKSGTLTTANGGEHGELQEFTFVAGGNAKWYSYFGRSEEEYEKKEDS